MDDVFRGAGGPRMPFGGSFAPSLDVRLAHDIADEVEARMRRAGRHLDRVCVHVHPAATPQAQPRAGSQAGSSGIGP